MDVRRCGTRAHEPRSGSGLETSGRVVLQIQLVSLFEVLLRELPRSLVPHHTLANSPGASAKSTLHDVPVHAAALWHVCECRCAVLPLSEDCAAAPEPVLRTALPDPNLVGAQRKVGARTRTPRALHLVGARTRATR